MLLLPDTPVTYPSYSTSLISNKNHRSQTRTRLLLPDVPIIYPSHSTNLVLDNKRWSQKRTKLHIEREGESMDIRF